jgi:hypothetical protein
VPQPPATVLHGPSTAGEPEPNPTLTPARLTVISAGFADVASELFRGRDALDKARNAVPELRNVVDGKIKTLTGSSRLLAFSRVMADPKKNALFKEMLQDPRFFVLCRQYLHNRAQASGLKLDLMGARTPEEMLSFAERAAEAERPIYAQAVATTEVDSALTRNVDQFASAEVAGRLIESYMKQTNRVYSGAAKRFLTPEELIAFNAKSSPPPPK